MVPKQTWTNSWNACCTHSSRTEKVVYPFPLLWEKNSFTQAISTAMLMIKWWPGLTVSPYHNSSLSYSSGCCLCKPLLKIHIPEAQLSSTPSSRHYHDFSAQAWPSCFPMPSSCYNLSATKVQQKQLKWFSNNPPENKVANINVNSWDIVFTLDLWFVFHHETPTEGVTKMMQPCLWLCWMPLGLLFPFFIHEKNRDF